MSWAILTGDCVEQMRELADESIDAVVCDPPYGIGFMGHEWDQPGEYAAVRANGTPGVFASGRPYPGNHQLGGRDRPPTTDPGTTPTSRDRGGAMEAGRYDLSLTANRRFQAWCEAWAAEALRVLKPGGHLLASCGTRTYHRLAAGIEDAGFEIRDEIMWLYASGFPKSLNLDRLRGETFCGCDGDPTPQYDLPDVPDEDVSPSEGAAGGKGSVLQPSVPKSSAPEDGPATGNRDAGQSQSGMEGRRDDQAPEGQLRRSAARKGAQVGTTDGEGGRLHSRASVGYGDDGGSPADAGGSSPPPRPRSDEQCSAQPGAVADQRLAQDGRGWPDCPRCGLPVIPRGLGTALKPSHEPVVVARKPFAGTVAEAVLTYGTSAINIDACRLTAGERPARLGLGEDTEGKNTYGSGGPGGGSRAIGTTDLGRWPANVALSHTPLCVQLGVVEIPSDGHFPAARGPSGYGSNGNHPESSGGGLKGHEGLEERHMAGELVEAWECAPGCPVAALDAQSGTLRDAAGASRFFYCAKTSQSERDAGLLEGLPRTRDPRKRYQQDRADRWRDRARNRHPTVKPIDLMRWLLRMVTPPAVPYCPACEVESSNAVPPDDDGSMPPMRQAVQGRRSTEPQAGVLQPDLREQVEAGEEDREDPDGKGLHRSAPTGPSGGVEAGLCDGASGGYGAAARTAADAAGGRASRQRDQGRQSAGESTVDAEGPARSTAEEAGAVDPVSALRRADSGAKSPVRCSACGAELAWRAGVVLDPFLGSGSTGCAAMLEGFDFVGIDRERGYAVLAEARVRWWEQHRGREAEEVLADTRRSTSARRKREDAGQLALLG